MSDYDYLNARVKGMSRHLLTPEFYDQVLAADAEELLVDALLSSAYGPQLKESLSVLRGLAAVESALRRNLYATFARVRSYAPDEPRNLLNIQFNRWEIANIRAIIRGKICEASQEDILEAVFPVGQFDDAQLTELAAEANIVAVADALIAWNYAFAFPLRGAIREHMEPPDLLSFEAAVDGVFFKWALDCLRREDPNHAMVHSMTQMQIDLANIMTALRIVHEKDLGRHPDVVEPIPGGRLSHDALEKVRGVDNLESAFETLEDTYFAPAIERGILSFGETRRLGVMERFLEELVIQAGCKMFRMDPLSVAVPLGFVWRKYNEFLNLRILLRGKAYHMPPAAIREELLFV